MSRSAATGAGSKRRVMRLIVTTSVCGVYTAWTPLAVAGASQPRGHHAGPVAERSAATHSFSLAVYDVSGGIQLDRNYGCIVLN